MSSPRWNYSDGFDWAFAPELFCFRPSVRTWAGRCVLLGLNGLAFVGTGALLLPQFYVRRGILGLGMGGVVITVIGVGFLILSVRSGLAGSLVEEVSRELVGDSRYCDVGVLASSTGDYELVLRRAEQIVFRSIMRTEKSVLVGLGMIMSRQLQMQMWVDKPPGRRLVRGFEVGGQVPTVAAPDPTGAPLMHQVMHQGVPMARPVIPLEVLPVDEAGERSVP